MARRDPPHELAILGGGIIGLACAWAAARQGCEVRLLERGPLAEPDRPLAGAGAATWASAGMLAPLADLPAPGPFFEVCRRSRDLWPDWADGLASAAGWELDYSAEGAILLGDDAAPGHGSVFLEGMRAAALASGEAVVEHDRAALVAALPDLAHDFGQGLRLPGEHRVDNRQVQRALTIAAGLAGVHLSGGFEALEVRRRQGLFEIVGASSTIRASRVLVAAGAWSSGISGLPALPVAPIRGQMFAVGQVDWPYFGSVRGAEFYAVRRRDGRLLVGATVEDAGFAVRPTARGLAHLHEWLARVFPGLVDRPLVEIWAGLRPATPDHLPAIGEMAPGLFVAGGHFRNGILLAPWTAGLVADLLAGREVDALDRQALAAFDPDRWRSGGRR